MENHLLHTPEGVRDIYNNECEQKMLLENRLLDAMKGYGFHPIQTPTFEYFDIFSKEIGTIPSKDLYKFFDRDGNTLVLRPDFTPSIARCAANYFLEDEVAERLCYKGNTYINNNSYQGRLKERTQIGAELIGDASVAADAEMLAMMIESLKLSGLSEFQVSVGHVDFLKGLFEYSYLGAEKEERVIQLLLNRNFYGVEEIIHNADLKKNLVYLYDLLSDVMMTREKLTAALEVARPYPTIANAIARLIQLDELLALYDVDKFVFYELALISSHDYYSGIIFGAYTYGSGEAIGNGGRYDHLLNHFGKQAASIGFCIIVDHLMSALTHQNLLAVKKNDTTCIVYETSRLADAIKEATTLRQKGISVEMLPITAQNTKETYEAYGKRKQVKDMIFFEA